MPIAIPDGFGAPGPFPLTDLGNAARFLAQHGDSVLYCYGEGWLCYDGRRWIPNAIPEVEARLIGTLRQIRTEFEARFGPAAESRITYCESAKGVEGALKMARHQVSVDRSELDRHPFLLNVANGTLDLERQVLRPHDRRDGLTKVLEVPYLPDAPRPVWDAFLQRVVPDDGTRGFLKRAIGNALTGDVSEQVLYFLYGSGSNGKSTFLNTLLDLLRPGGLGIQATPDLLLASNGSEHPTKFADLRGVRFVCTVELDEGKKLAESLVKALTGGEYIRARRMREDFSEFAPTHKLFLAANHRPQINATDNGIWRRIRLVPFTQTIGDEERDPHLPEKLRAELPGILAWAVEGCYEWMRGGLRPPAEVTQATASYRSDMDVLGDFLKECCERKKDLRVENGQLWNAYLAWCERNHEPKLGRKQFSQQLTDRGLTQAKSGPRWWEGIGLTISGRMETFQG